MRSAVEHELSAQGTELQLGVGVLDVRGRKVRVKTEGLEGELLLTQCGTPAQPLCSARVVSNLTERFQGKEGPSARGTGRQVLGV